MSQHTPGPWKTTPYSGVVGCVITAQPDKNKNQFNIGSIHGGQNKEEVLANAKLVASTPDLLKACLDTLVHLSAIQEMIPDEGIVEDPGQFIMDVQSRIDKAWSCIHTVVTKVLKDK